MPGLYVQDFNNNVLSILTKGCTSFDLKEKDIFGFQAVEINK